MVMGFLYPLELSPDPNQRQCPDSLCKIGLDEAFHAEGVASSGESLRL